MQCENLLIPKGPGQSILLFLNPRLHIKIYPFFAAGTPRQSQSSKKHPQTAGTHYPTYHPNKTLPTETEMINTHHIEQSSVEEVLTTIRTLI